MNLVRKMVVFGSLLLAVAVAVLGSWQGGLIILVFAAGAFVVWDKEVA